jgi:hypothetical protein
MVFGGVGGVRLIGCRWLTTRLGPVRLRRDQMA